MSRVLPLLLAAVLAVPAFAQAPASASEDGRRAAAALSARAAQSGLPALNADAFLVTGTAPVGTGRAVYLQQHIDGVPVLGTEVTVALDADGRAMHVAGQMRTDVIRASVQRAALSEAAAVEAAASAVGLALRPLVVEARKADRTVFAPAGTLDPISVRPLYAADGTGALRRAWEVSLSMPDARNWWLVRVDAATGAELSRLDLTIHDTWGGEHAASLAPLAEAAPAVLPTAPLMGDGSSYLVYAMPVEAPIYTTPGPPADARTAASEPASAASPFGWHDTNGVAGAEFTITRGNNVHAYQDSNNSNSSVGDEPDGGAALSFAPSLDLSQAPSAYRPAAVVNLFYWNNLIHDVMAEYGFDEASGNFQVTNYSGAGAGGDDVRAEAQDGGGNCNANMSTSPDGNRPRMQMYTCSNASPSQDGDFDNGVIVHEYGHGISIRLTGGAGTSSCLNNTEQMGEGWSDYFGIMMTMEPGDARTDVRGLGNYLFGQGPTGGGIRPAPYTTNFAVNGFTHSDVGSGVSVPHGVGFVWATILWEMTWDLIDAHGFDPDLYDAAGTAGNQIALQLVMDGLKLQPCSPGFVDGRDAILAADAARYPDAANPGRGVHYGTLWQAFARRGLGASASQGSTSSVGDNTDGFDTPLPPAFIAAAPGALSATLAEGDTDTQAVTVSNTAAPGSSALDVSVRVTNLSQPDDARTGDTAARRAARVAAPSGRLTVEAAEPVRLKTGDAELPAAFGSGGPDAFGYAWSDSDEAGGPAVAFQDISSTGTALSFSAADDGSASVALPFAFPFYGTDRSTVLVSTNGYLTFGTSGTAYSNTGIPNAANPNALVAPYWDDLHVRTGTAYAGTAPDGRFVIQWTNWGRYSPSSGEDLTFQVLLSADGTIEYQYATLVTTVGNSATVGIEDDAGTDGLQVVTNSAYLTSDFAVRITQPTLWASASPGSLSLTPGASGLVDVMFDATGLPDGVYTADLLLNSNDPTTPTTTLPLTMTVGSAGGTATIDITSAGAYVLAPPAAGITVDDLAADNLVIGVPGYNPDRPANLRTGFDGTKIWMPSAGTGEVLQLGMGFQWILTGANRDYGSGSVSRPLPMTMTHPSPNTADVTVPLQTAGNAINIFGNPFGVPLDISGIASWPDGTKVSSNVFLWDVTTKRWVFDAGITEIAPWTAFFVRTRPGRTGTLTIPASAAVSGARDASAGASVAEGGLLRFELDGATPSGERLGDAALALTVGEAATAEPKLRPLSTAYVAAAFSSGDALRAIEALGTDAASVELPISVTAVGAVPELVLRWDAPRHLPAAWRLTLVDRSTGAEVDLSAAGRYAFRTDTRPALDAVPDGLAALDKRDASERFVLRVDTGDGAFAKDGDDAGTLALSAPVPNPSRGTARVAFTLAEAGSARLTLVDALGRTVAVLSEGELSEGRHTADLDGARLAAGVYVLRLEAGGRVLTQRATVTR